MKLQGESLYALFRPVDEFSRGFYQWPYVLAQANHLAIQITYPAGHI